MQPITVETIINAPVGKVWTFWSQPEHVTQWAFASEDWEAPFAENDLKVGGKFLTRMSAKDGTGSFDFNGVYTNVVLHKEIDYTMEGGRKVSIRFSDLGNGNTKIVESFEPESENPEEMQRAGWQSILDNFKQYSEKVVATEK